ncbi:TOBE domain-containing protein [Methylocucumis oryzae]|uniref:TOBE domain-containing protein n=1 Tax=Methylocucumis oryzae TaxID=1632867 RepID=UPI0030842B03
MAETLGIKAGIDVSALVRAPQVIIVSDFGGYRLSARNQLSGTVSQIHKGQVNSEVVLGLVDGDTIIATVTNDSWV